jgi:suppressor of ftsI
MGTAIAGCGVVESVRGRQVSTIGEVEFTRELAIPPLAESTLDAEGRRCST